MGLRPPGNRDGGGKLNVTVIFKSYIFISILLTGSFYQIPIYFIPYFQFNSQDIQEGRKVIIG
jgi:hypothetical protein